MKLDLDEFDPVDKRERSNGTGISVLWYSLVIASIVFMVIGIFAGNPFIDYQTASTL
jgi:hypothetical protein